MARLSRTHHRHLHYRHLPPRYQSSWHRNPDVWNRRLRSRSRSLLMSQKSFPDVRNSVKGLSEKTAEYINREEMTPRTDSHKIAIIIVRNILVLTASSISLSASSSLPPSFRFFFSANQRCPNNRVLSAIRPNLRPTFRTGRRSVEGRKNDEKRPHANPLGLTTSLLPSKYSFHRLGGNRSLSILSFSGSSLDTPTWVGGLKRSE